MTSQYKQENTHTTHSRKALPSLGNQLSCSRALPTPLAYIHTINHMYPHTHILHLPTCIHMNAHTLCREREGKGTLARLNANSIFLKTLLHEDEPEMPSGLLAPRANTKTSVQWANKYSVLLLRQPGFKSSWSHGILTPLSLLPPPAPPSVISLSSGIRQSSELEKRIGKGVCWQTEQNPVFLSFFASFLYYLFFPQVFPSLGEGV